LNQPQGMSAKMAANGIRTHARTNQRPEKVLEKSRLLATLAFVYKYEHEVLDRINIGAHKRRRRGRGGGALVPLFKYIRANFK